MLAMLGMGVAGVDGSWVSMVVIDAAGGTVLRSAEVDAAEADCTEADRTSARRKWLLAIPSASS